MKISICINAFFVVLLYGQGLATIPLPSLPPGEGDCVQTKFSHQMVEQLRAEHMGRVGSVYL
jgi:hypothetical protein